MTLILSLALAAQALIVVRLIADEYRRCWVREVLRQKYAAREQAVAEVTEVEV